MLYDAVAEDCHIMDKTTVPDGRGGVETVYVEGAKVSISFSFDDSTAARIASQEGVINRHTLVMHKNLVLNAGDVIRRDKTKKTYLITTDGEDNATPAVAALDMRQVEAKEWTLPGRIEEKKTNG